MSSDISKKKRLSIYNKYNGKCAYCGINVELNRFHVDHILAKHNGGGNGYDNLNPSCVSCNISKSVFSIEKWRNEIRKKIDRLRRDNTNFRLLERYGVINFTKQDIVFHFEKHHTTENYIT